MNPFELLDNLINQAELKDLYKARQILDIAIAELEQKLEMDELDKARLLHEVLTEKF